MAFLPDKPADNDEIRLGAKQIRDNFNGVVNDGIAIAKPPLFGMGIPVAALGKVGERYFNTATGDQYLKTGSGWTLVLSMSIKADQAALDAAFDALSTTKVDHAALDTLSVQVSAINSFLVGTVFMFAAETPPKGTLVGDGSLAPIKDYPDLFGVTGFAHTPEGETAPRGYFFLPNYMDYFLRGHNPASGRKFGSEQEDAIRNITGTFTAIVGGKWHNGKRTGAFHKSAWYAKGPGSSWGETYVHTISFDASYAENVRIAEENRPKNKTVLFCIKY